MFFLRKILFSALFRKPSKKRLEQKIVGRFVKTEFFVSKGTFRGIKSFFCENDFQFFYSDLKNCRRFVAKINEVVEAPLYVSREHLEEHFKETVTLFHYLSKFLLDQWIFCHNFLTGLSIVHFTCFSCLVNCS